MKLFFNQTELSYESILQEFKPKDFWSPERSTIPLMSWLRPPAAEFRSFVHGMGFPDDFNVHVEFKVWPPRGDGEASHTDAMVTAANKTLAIEAKWTENRYDTVARWLGKGTSPINRVRVLEGWLSHLQPFAKGPLRAGDFGNAVYQTVHRAASACAVAGPNGTPAMAFLLYYQKTDEGFSDRIQKYREDLGHIRELLGKPDGFLFSLATISLKPTDAYGEISYLKKEEEETARRIRKALAPDQPPLFQFGATEIETI